DAELDQQRLGQTVTGKLRGGQQCYDPENHEPEQHEDERTAASVTRLVVVLFGLVVLGVVALLSTAELSGDGLAQALLVKLGIMLLVVGAAYGGTLLVLARIRGARRQQQFTDLTRESLQRAHQPQEQRVIEVGPR
ncbi:MAG: hypothetical protein JWR88_759, partial [Pseudonocardia sp.]|nr:hypothetical protein [Pseudonocardia sp.]